MHPLRQTVRCCRGHAEAVDSWGRRGVGGPTGSGAGPILRLDFWLFCPNLGRVWPQGPGFSSVTVTKLSRWSGRLK